MSNLTNYNNLRRVFKEGYEEARKLSLNNELLGRITRVYPVEVSEGRRAVAIEVSFHDYVRYVSSNSLVGIGSVLAILNPITKCIFLGVVTGYRREDLLSIMKIPIINPPKDPSTMKTPLILYLDLIAEAALSNGELRDVKPPTTPLEPNSPVFIPKSEVIKELLRIPKEGVLLGYLRTGTEVRKDVEVRVPLDTLYHHILVIGTTGSGKTVLLKNIALSVINEYRRLNPLIIAFDLQGDYLKLVTEGNSVYEALKELWVLLPVTKSLINELSKDLRSNDLNDLVKEVCSRLASKYVRMTYGNLVKDVKLGNVVSDEGGNNLIIKYLDVEVSLTNGDSFKLRLVPWSLRFYRVGSELGDFVPMLSTQARMFIKDVVNMLMNVSKFKLLDDVFSNVRLLTEKNSVINKKLNLHSSTVGNIIRCLITLRSTELFDCFISTQVSNDLTGLGSVWFDEPNYIELFESSSNLLVIDLRWCRFFASSPYAETILIYRVLDKLFKWKDMRLREGRESRPTILLLDEAHNYFPQGGRELIYKEIIEEVINKVMRLGRVRGLGTVFATHQPADLNKLILQLTNTKIALRSDEGSLKSIGLEGYYEELRSAPSGYAVLTTYAVGTEVIKILTPPPSGSAHE